MRDVAFCAVMLAFFRIAPCALCLSLLRTLFPQAFQILKDFMLATTLKDCSVMITLAVLDPAVCIAEDEDSFWRTLTLGDHMPVLAGHRLAYTAHVVDLDPKDVMKVPHYKALDARILEANLLRPIQEHVCQL